MTKATIRAVLNAMLLLISTVSLSAESGASSSNLAGRLVRLSGRASNPRGVVVLPENSELAIELALASNFRVIAQESDHVTAQQARSRAMAANLLAKRINVVQAPASCIVTADRSANLIVYLRGIPKLEVATLIRKLAPYGGRGLIRADNGMSEADLRSWAGTPDGAEVRIIEDPFGLWAVIERGAVEDADEWTHTYHDADNNPYSRDSSLSWPFVTQWLGKPYQDGGAVQLIAGGRLFVVNEGDFTISDR